jgi:hypothetical protein
MKKQFRLTAIFCAGILLFLTAGCRKDDPENAAVPTTPSPQYYMRFKIDGVQKSYGAAGNSCTFNTLNNATGNYSSSVLGRINPTVVGTNEVIVMINDAPVINAGVTYTNYTSTQPNTVPLTQLFSIFYYDESGHETFNMAENLFAPLGLTSDATMQLSELNAAHARGTFSCTLYDTTLSAPVHVLTEGEFYLPRY